MANLFQFGRTILEEQEEYSERTEKFLELPLWRYDHHGFLAAWLVAGNGSVRCSGDALIIAPIASQTEHRWTKPSTRTRGSSGGDKTTTDDDLRRDGSRGEWGRAKSDYMAIFVDF